MRVLLSWCLLLIVCLFACGDDDTSELVDARRDVATDTLVDASDVQVDTSADIRVDTPTDVSEQVPVLIAIGHLGRTLRSCDDGQTWQDDTNFAASGDRMFCGEVQELHCEDGRPTARWTGDGTNCVEHETWNCDHNPGSPMGLVFTEGNFVAQFGWGAYASTRVSTDGVEWNVVREARRPTFNRLHVLSDRIFATATRPTVSLDGGLTWRDSLNFPDFGPGVLHVRAQGIIRSNAGERIWLIGRSSGAGMAYSDDRGDTWTSVPLPPEECMPRGLIGFYAQGGNLHLLTSEGDCVSTDDAQSWTHQTWEELGAEFAISRAYQVGDSIVAHGNGDIMRNTGGTWERFDQPNRWPSRVFQLGDDWLAIEGNSYDEDLVVRRSTDGVNWIEDETAMFPAGHGVRHIVRGWVDTCE